MLSRLVGIALSLRFGPIGTTDEGNVFVMIEFRSGDILKIDAEALVNTVNCVGVMGRDAGVDRIRRQRSLEVPVAGVSHGGSRLLDQRRLARHRRIEAHREVLERLVVRP